MTSLLGQMVIQLFGGQSDRGKPKVFGGSAEGNLFIIKQHSFLSEGGMSYMQIISPKYDFSFKELLNNEVVRKHFICDVLDMSVEKRI